MRIRNYKKARKENSSKIWNWCEQKTCIFFETKGMQIYKENFNSAIKYKISLKRPNTEIQVYVNYFRFFFLGNLYLQNRYMGSLRNFANKLLKYKPTTESIGCLEILICINIDTRGSQQPTLHNLDYT